VAHGDYWLIGSRAEEWQLIEWKKGESEPTKYWLSTIPQCIAFRDLVDAAKLRWQCDYHELKRKVGLVHFEGQGWRGFHQHSTLSIIDYGFLISPTGQRFPLTASHSARMFQELGGPDCSEPPQSRI
jgi:SRSO17 transposase